LHEDALILLTYYENMSFTQCVTFTQNIFEFVRYMLGGPNNTTVSWTDAFSLCNMYGGVLASPAHMEEIITVSEGTQEFCPYIPIMDDGKPTNTPFLYPGLFQGNASVNTCIFISRME
jgi:hypothetical protein